MRLRFAVHCACWYFRMGIDAVSKTNVRIRGELIISETKFDRPLPTHMWIQAQKLGMFKPVIRRISNLIVDIGLDAFAAIMGGGENNPTVGATSITTANFQDLRIVEMQITDQVSPAAPLISDTALEGTTLWTGNVSSPPIPDAVLVVTYPATGQVRFSLAIPQTSLTDKTFTEEAIFAKNGEMIARTTFNKPHPVTFGIQFDHTLFFERVP